MRIPCGHGCQTINLCIGYKIYPFCGTFILRESFVEARSCSLPLDPLQKDLLV